MANEARTGDPRGFNISKFRDGSRVRQTPEEGREIYRPKLCGNNNKDENNSPKTLNDKKKKKKLETIVDFAVPADHRIKLKLKHY